MSKADKKKVFDVVKKLKGHAYFGTCQGRQPVIRSISPILDDKMNIWIATFAKSRKVRQIRKNPKVCLYFVAQPNGSRGACVLGRARITKSLRVKKRVWAAAHYDLSGYFRAGPADKNFCLMMVVPRVIEWWPNWKVGRKVYRP
jgi:general stress protein 26